MKELWQKPDAALLDFSACLYHTEFINRQEVTCHMNAKFVEELRQKYIQDPPIGMTAELVRNMTDSDLLDMHEFLTEEDDFDDDEFEEGFYIF